MSDIREQFSEEVSLLRKYAYEFGNIGTKELDDDTYDLMIKSQVALHKMFEAQQAEIQRLNAIIQEMQQVDDVLAPQNEIDAKRYRWLKCETYNQEIVICRWNKNGCTEMFVDYIDKAIDEAMTK